jgi:hypothetical protein
MRKQPCQKVLQGTAQPQFAAQGEYHQNQHDRQGGRNDEWNIQEILLSEQA